MHQDATEEGFGADDIVLDRAHLPPKGYSPQFSAHVYCGQTAVCIRIPLRTEVRFGLGDIVLDGDPTPLPSLSCLSCPVCDVRALGPNGWTDQDETWHAGRPRPWPHCVRWGPSSPSPKWHSPPSIFGPYLLRPNGCMDQDVTWYGARPRPRRLCVRWGPSPLPPKRGGAPFSYFWPISIVAKRLDASRCHLVWMFASAQGTLC